MRFEEAALPRAGAPVAANFAGMEDQLSEVIDVTDKIEGHKCDILRTAMIPSFLCSAKPRTS